MTVLDKLAKVLSVAYLDASVSKKSMHMMSS